MGKIRQSVAIPDRLLAFLRDVQSQIVAGAEETLIESDDLLQPENHCAYGGLVDAKEGLFCFCYFPVAECDLTWDMCFGREDLKAIAAGEIEQLSLWKCDNPACECLFECENAYCGNCDSQTEQS